ncbi:5-formaminoimidazole-4-carboxamide-1-(beta)-D-ribofuranosyl 5'-monophosphate synthetase [Thermococci archaeon]|nr:MAG: 5-formaminoimidazole-4-carboxamide-1-(beta)-D-ribofuranosyl 5'-monophosphate synthetase [Thermococci archaeon]
MISQERIKEILESYGGEITIGTIASHSALQILHGARQEGFDTLLITTKDREKLYRNFNVANFTLFVENFKDILSSEVQDELIERNCVLIPHGSFVEYIGPKNILDKLEVPCFGNRLVLEWESDRRKEREWLTSSGLKMPREVKPDEIDGPVIVKFFGAKGGRDFFLASSEEEYWDKIRGREKEPHVIQEYVVGTRFYLHYFYSPLNDEIEFTGSDIRYESNVDGLTRIPDWEKYFSPTYVVTGNIPVILRESLLPEVFEMGERVVKKSKELFYPGMIGPFCLETVCTDELEFYVFEISARIVAGTSLYVWGSPYTWVKYNEPMSTGRRIALEIKRGLETNRESELIW